MFVIRDREAGNEIESANSLSEATRIIAEYETQDKKDGVYAPNFYETVEVETETETEAPIWSRQKI